MNKGVALACVVITDLCVVLACGLGYWCSQLEQERICIFPFHLFFICLKILGKTINTISIAHHFRNTTKDMIAKNTRILIISILKESMIMMLFF